MKRLIATAAFLAWACAWLGATASAGVLDKVAGVAGERVLGMEAPDLGKSGSLGARSFTIAQLGDESRTLYSEAKPWADKLMRADSDLDKLYDAYRKSPGKAALEPIETARKERDYYSAVWKNIVEPSKDFKRDDPRITPILQVLYYYLNPLPARVERLEEGKTEAAKNVEAARDTARAHAARLYEDDRKVVEEFGLSGKGFDVIKAAIIPDRRESKEYMGWVRSAYDKTAEWATAVKVNESFAEQYSWVYVDYTAHSKLLKTLMDKKLGPLSII